jgi:hypothetical protein
MARNGQGPSFEISGTSHAKMLIPEAQKGLKKNSAAFPLVFALDFEDKLAHAWCLRLS